MARGRKAAATPGPDHNQGPSRSSFLEHYDNLVEKLAAKLSADSAVANAYKAAERDGIDRKMLKRVLAENKKTAAELEIYDAKHRRYREWLGKPVGTQAAMDLSNDNKPATNGHGPEATAAVEKHEATETFRAGTEAGKAGAAIASNPYPPGSERAQQWSTGWSAGQKEAVHALGGATHRAAPV